MVRRLIIEDRRDAGGRAERLAVTAISRCDSSVPVMAGNTSLLRSVRRLLISERPDVPCSGGRVSGNNVKTDSIQNPAAISTPVAKENPQPQPQPQPTPIAAVTLEPPSSAPLARSIGPGQGPEKVVLTVVSPTSVDERPASVSWGSPCCALNLAGSIGEIFLVGLGLALAHNSGGVAYLEGVSPKARAVRAKSAEFAAAALARDGHAVADWGRLCIGVSSAVAAAKLMPALVAHGKGGDAPQGDVRLIVVGDSCTFELIELLAQQGQSHGAKPMIVALGAQAIGGATSLCLGHFDRRAISHGLLLGATKRALTKLASRIESESAR